MRNKFFKAKKILLLILFTLFPPLFEAKASPKREGGVLVNPFSRENRVKRGKFFSLTEEKNTLDLVKEQFLVLEGLSLEKIEKSFFPEEVEEYKYFYKGKALCEKTLKIIEREDLFPLVFGEEISVGKGGVPSGHFDFLQIAEKLARNSLGEDKKEKVLLSSGEACYFYQEDSLREVYRFKLQYQGKLYEVFASAKEVLKKKELFLPLQGEVTGEIQTYAYNNVLSDLETFKFSFKGTGYLENSRFETYLGEGAPEDLTRAYAEDHKFLYSPEDPFFAEASVFAHAAGMYNFFLSLGFKEWHNKPFLLKIYSVFGGSGGTNNAMYVPYDGEFDYRPVISIGEGDGLVLKNLLLDGDVVSHEMAHHVIFSTLTTTVGESLALHEGLADYFAFAHSGDACLGESICPDTSLACVVYKNCLRTGLNSFIFDEENMLGFDWHTEGQIISGTLWDLRSVLGEKLLDKLVLQAINYFLSNTGYYGLILSLMRADEVLHKGEHQCEIFDAFMRRGFDSYLEGLSCDNVSRWKADTGISSDDYLRVGEIDPASDDAYDDDSSCGALLFFPHLPGGGRFVLLLLLLMPLALVFFHRFFYYGALYKSFSFKRNYFQKKRRKTGKLDSQAKKKKV